MSKPGALEYDYSPLRSSCPRCGAMEEEPCLPVQPHAHATILGYHAERGVSPGHLMRDEGYVEYVLVDDDGTRMHLWRRPSQRPVRRGAWKPEGELRACTCGGSDYVSCLCNLTPREWLAYAKTNPRVDQGLALPKELQ